MSLGNTSGAVGLRLGSEEKAVQVNRELLKINLRNVMLALTHLTNI